MEFCKGEIYKMAFVGNAFRSVARFVAPAVGPLVGAITLNPLLAAGAAATATAVAGGNRRQILSRAAGAGLGTATGGATTVGGALGRKALTAGASLAFSDTKVGQQLAPAVVAGVTGNPLLAAGAGAHSAVSSGGNLRDAVAGAATAGVGAMVGAKSPGVSSWFHSGAAKGALAGQLVGNAVRSFAAGNQKIADLAVDRAQMQSPRSVDQTQATSFSDIREEVVKETAKVFSENRSIVAGVAVRPMPFVNIYNRRFFAPLRDIAKRKPNGKRS